MPKRDLPLRKKVLIVEDDPSLYHFWIRLIPQIKEGEIEITNSAKKALNKLESQPVHILLTDLNMPDCDGWMLAKAARQLNADAKIILTSTEYNESELTKKGTSFTHFIKKPYRNIEHIREFLHLLLNDDPIIDQAEQSWDNIYCWDL